MNMEILISPEILAVIIPMSIVLFIIAIGSLRLTFTFARIGEVRLFICATLALFLAVIIFRILLAGFHIY